MAPEETVANLRSILASDEFNDLQPGSFQYIDLRFGNKVFVNKEDPSLIAASTTATSSPVTPVEAALTSVPVEEEEIATATTTETISDETTADTATSTAETE